MTDIEKLYKLWMYYDSIKDLTRALDWDYNYAKRTLPFRVIGVWEVHNITRMLKRPPLLREVPNKIKAIFKTPKYMMRYAGFRKQWENDSSARDVGVIRGLDIYRTLFDPVIELPDKYTLAVPVPDGRFTAHHLDINTLTYHVITNKLDPLHRTKEIYKESVAPYLNIELHEVNV